MEADGSGWYRRRQGQLSRRNMLRISAAGTAGLAVTGLSACSKPAPTTGVETGTGKEPKRGGTLRRHQGPSAFDGTGFDPSTSALAFGMPFGLWYQTLVRQNSDTLEIESVLAERWEQPNQTEYILTLRSGVKWHNKPPVSSRPFTVDDAVFGLRRVLEGGPRVTAKSILSGVDRIEAIDGGRLRVMTKEPNATTLARLAAPNIAFLAPEVFERFDKLITPESVIGTGAFMLQSGQAEVGYKAVRNPDYWKPGLPYLDAVEPLYFAEELSQLAAFLGGQLHITRVTGSEAKKFAATYGSRYGLGWAKSIGTLPLEPNTRLAPFNDVRVTKALRLLIDHDEFATAWSDTFQGGGQFICVFPDFLDQWDLTQDEYRRLLEWQRSKEEAAGEAMKLLSAAGFTQERPLRFQFSYSTAAGRASRESGAQLLQQQWKRWSQGVVDVTIGPEDYPVLLRKGADKTFTYMWFNEAASVVEPDAWLKEVYHSTGSRNFFGFSDPKVDAMIDQQSRTFDTQLRRALIREVITYLLENSPVTVPYGRWYLHASQLSVRDYSGSWLGENYMDGYMYERVWLNA